MIYRFGSFQLDSDEARLFRDGRPLEAQPKVLDALRLFVENPGRLLGREELLERLWPGVFVTEESLTQIVRKLRLLLGDDPQHPEYLQTVLKRGYRFVAEVEAVRGVPEAAPAALETAATAPAGARDAGRPRGPARPMVRWAFALGALAVGVVAVSLLRSRGDGARPVRGGAAAAPLERRLTATPERETFPSLAPDGTRYAFVRSSALGESFDLYVATIGGGESRLTATPGDEFAPQFSPDGHTLLYSRRDEGRPSLWRLPVLGGPPERLSDDGEWGTWSPDGLRVAFVRRAPGGRSEVIARRVDGTGAEEVLWNVAEPLEALVWSPDGGQLAAVGEGRILVGGAAADAEVRDLGAASEYIRSLAWEPDGRALIADGRWLGTGGNLVRLSLAGGDAQAVTVGSNGLFHPSLSRDGRLLLYAAEHKVRQIWRFDGDRHAVAALSLPTGLECFDVSPDGRELAASDWQPPPGSATLVLHDLETKAARPLGEGLCPAFSPDGSRLAFLGHQPDDLGLWILDLATGARERVAEDRGEIGLSERNAARRPSWSPDSRSIAFESMGLAGGDGLRVIELATGATLLLAPGVFGNPAFSPAGDRIAVSGAGPEVGFAFVDLAGGEARRALPGGAYRASPAWRDADTALFLVSQQNRPAHVAVDAATLVAAAPEPFDLPIDASFWGIYEALPDRAGGWLVTVERYESDLYLLAR